MKGYAVALALLVGCGSAVIEIVQDAANGPSNDAGTEASYNPPNDASGPVPFAYATADKESTR